ncbi:MAG: chemotaxis protein CheW [Nocardioidaceae bacterium]
MRYVRLVVRNRGARRLPASAGAMVGLTLVRGDAVPLLDLASVLGVGGVDLGRDLVVVIDGEHPALGLLVDEVVATESVPDEQLRSVAAGPENAAGLERAVTPHGVVLLDAEVLLSGHHLDSPTRRPSPGAPPPRSADGR